MSMAVIQYKRSIFSPLYSIRLVWVLMHENHCCKKGHIFQQLLIFDLVSFLGKGSLTNLIIVEAVPRLGAMPLVENNRQYEMNII